MLVILLYPSLPLPGRCCSCATVSAQVCCPACCHAVYAVFYLMIYCGKCMSVLQIYEGLARRSCPCNLSSCLSQLLSITPKTKTKTEAKFPVTSLQKPCTDSHFSKTPCYQTLPASISCGSRVTCWLGVVDVPMESSRSPPLPCIRSTNFFADSYC